MSATNSTKTCNGCSTVKDRSEFNRTKGTCKDCIKNKVQQPLRDLEVRVTKLEEKSSKYRQKLREVPTVLDFERLESRVDELAEKSSEVPTVLDFEGLESRVDELAETCPDHPDLLDLKSRVVMLEEKLRNPSPAPYIPGLENRVVECVGKSSKPQRQPRDTHTLAALQELQCSMMYLDESHGELLDKLNSGRDDFMGLLAELRTEMGKLELENKSLREEISRANAAMGFYHQHVAKVDNRLQEIGDLTVEISRSTVGEVRAISNRLKSLEDMDLGGKDRSDLHRMMDKIVDEVEHGVVASPEDGVARAVRRLSDGEKLKGMIASLDREE